ncbi:MAG: aminotransferase class V-fold PLP-dependent enzyme [Gammaproteobacteria bacterium]|nr:aminotransferase class V-fold PLP-dependent enzyme [Gammaproteobacteria bacterium]
MDKGYKSPHVDDRRDFAELLQRAGKTMVKHLTERPDLPVDCATPPEALRRELAAMSLPAEGMAANDILEFLDSKVMPWSMPTNHARSYAWVNTSPAPISILSDALAITLNNGQDAYHHSTIYMMHSLGRWLMELSGFMDADGTANGMAILLAGGSGANLNALSVARYWAAKRDGWNVREEGLQGNRPAMIYYTSAEAHSSVQLCVEQLGIGAANLRSIDTDDDFRMRPQALRAAIEADLAVGLSPACVVASMGSTNVGAIDPLDDIADLCEAFDLWLHVDGAYGGIVGLDPAYTQMTSPMCRVNSLTLDPHKWLQVPLDCGAVIVRERRLNYENYTLVPDYLRAEDTEEGSVPWPYEYMFELTFSDRALKTWAAIARLGRDGVRDMVINCNNLARLLGELIEKSDDLELLAPVSVSTVNFRYLPTDRDLPADDLDSLNQQISDRIVDSGEAHIPTTKVNGAVSLRACFLHYENCEADVHHLLALVRRFASL